MKPKYHKIDSIYKRDPATNHKTFLEGEWANPAFAVLSGVRWVATEKVDGTNTRIHVGNSDWKVGGRSDNAQLHIELVEALNVVGADALDADLGGLTLYGEGYGAGIQKGGGAYRQDKGFILFDVMDTESGVFLERSNVVDIAGQIGVPVVPECVAGTLEEIIDCVRSRTAEIGSILRPGHPLEGYVIRPEFELCDRFRRRVITKLKLRDYPL